MTLVPVPNAAPDVYLRSWGVPFWHFKVLTKGTMCPFTLAWTSQCTITQQAVLQTKCRLVAIWDRPCVSSQTSALNPAPHAGDRTSQLAQHRPVFNTALEHWDTRNSHMVSCQLTHFLYYCCWVISHVLGVNLVWGCVTVTFKWPQLMIQEKCKTCLFLWKKDWNVSFGCKIHKQNNIFWQ